MNPKEVIGVEDQRPLAFVEPRARTTTPEITVATYEDSNSSDTTWLRTMSFGAPELSGDASLRPPGYRLDRRKSTESIKSAGARRKTSIEEPYVFSLAQRTLESVRAAKEFRRLLEPGGQRSEVKDVVCEERELILQGQAFSSFPSCSRPTKEAIDHTHTALQGSSSAVHLQRSSHTTLQHWPIKTTADETRNFSLDVLPPAPDSIPPISSQAKGLFLCLPELPLRRSSLPECHRLEAIAEENITIMSKASRRYSSPFTTKSEI